MTPGIAVLRGSPDAAEVAALVTALALLAGEHDRRRPPPRRSVWAVPGARPGGGREWAGRHWARAVHPGGPA